MARGQVSLKRLTEDEARELLEGLRWSEGKACPHCGNCDQERIATLKAKENTKVRPGLYRCMECRKQFTVTVGTVMERSKVALRDWVYVFAAVCASKKGISAHQISRELGCQYKTAWFLCQRVRHAMSGESMQPLLSGVIQADETYVGGKPRNPGEVREKLPVITLIEKGGRARSRVECNVTARNLHKHILSNVDLKKSSLHTDEHMGYRMAGRSFADGHKTVNHSQREYVGKDGATSNEVEAYFSLLKRGIYGTFHHVSAQHLQRYVDEFDFRWSNRGMDDTERTYMALSQIDGKRLMYRKPSGTDVN